MHYNITQLYKAAVAVTDLRFKDADDAAADAAVTTPAAVTTATAAAAAVAAVAAVLGKNKF